MASSSLPKMFPKDIILPCNKLTPKEINWFRFRNAIDHVSKSYFEGKWSESNVESYLSTFGINVTATDKVITHCNNLKALENASKYNEKD